jgi:O-antigen/teichoic acid export membrane protein
MKISHVAWNFAGLSIPLIVAVMAMPHLLLKIGDERFGLLLLTWGLIGYSGVLDFGIGRSLTQIISATLAEKDNKKIAVALTTAVKMSIVIGLIGGLVICVISIIWFTNFLKVSEITERELALSAFIFAIALPLQSISTTYKAVNEAYLNFKVISIIRILLGVLTFGLPYVVSFYTSEMYYFIGTIALSRLFALFWYKRNALTCIAHIPSEYFKYSRSMKVEILKFGGWFTVSNVINPFIGSLDRLLIGSLISSAAITTYALPYEMTVQLLVLVGAVTTVAFPYLTTISSINPFEGYVVFRKILIITMIVMFFVAICQYFLGPELLYLWMSDNVGKNSILVINIMAFGLVPYTLGTMCISLLHAYGRTDLTAKLNLIEAPIFYILIYVMIYNYGVVGAAISWVVRIVIDSVILYFIAVNQMHKKITNFV